MSPRIRGLTVPLELHSYHCHGCGIKIRAAHGLCEDCEYRRRTGHIYPTAAIESEQRVGPWTNSELVWLGDQIKVRVKKRLWKAGIRRASA